MNSVSAQIPAVSPLSLKVVVLDALNFAIAHNSVPLVRELSFTNTGAAPLSGLEVTVALDRFASPWTGSIPHLARGATYHFQDIPLQYELNNIVNAAERDQARLDIRVESVSGEGAREDVLHESRPVAILAYNEWRRSSEPQMLASFVLPNHPDLHRVLDQAKERLLAVTGNPAMDGYQSKDSGRVRAVARAVYESLAPLGITYANPPASFEETGQKIRTPEQILHDRLATCLDTSALLAAALEQVGLHPLIVLVQGHAFPGVWLNEDYRGDAGFWDAAALRNEVALGTIEVFDSSASLHRPPVSFERAAATARQELANDDAFRFALDVRGARVQGYLPLPSRVYGSGFGGVQEVRVEVAPSVERRTHQATLTQADTAKLAAEDSPDVKEAKTRLLLWQKQLLDLSLRNRLLNFNPDGRHGTNVHCPLLPELEDALAGGERFVFHGKSAVFSGSDERSSQLRQAATGEDAAREYLIERFRKGIVHGTQPDDAHRSTLLKLERKAKESFEESGAHTLYLALGLLRWFEAPGSQQERFAPVLLLPVELERGSAHDPWAFSATDDTPVFNPSLIEKLQISFGIDLSHFSDELPTDGNGVDVPGIFADVRAAIRGMDRWELKEEAHLGHFSFTKHAMWRDLGALLADVANQPLLRSLARKGAERFVSGSGIPTERELDQQFPPQQVFCPLDADSSQLAAILGAAGGESFVLQGPPGTGKSQTITNLITHCLAVGKTVLFVSAKMAALQVVHRRLERSGVGAFCLELHSHAANKKGVLEQLGRSMQVAAASPPEWAYRTEALSEDRARLNAYADSIHRQRPQGATLRDGMGTLCKHRNAPVVQLELDPQRLSRADLDRRRRAMVELTGQAKHLGSLAAHPLRAVRRQTWSPGIQVDFERRLDDAQRTVAELLRCLKPLEYAIEQSLATATFAELMRLNDVLSEVTRRGEVFRGVLEAPDVGLAQQTTLAFVELGRKRDALRTQLDANYVDAFHQLDLKRISERLRIWGSAFLPLAFFMLWGTRRLLRSVHKHRDLPRNPRLLADVETGLALQNLEQRFDHAATAAQPLLAGRGGRDSDWEAIQRAIERTTTMRHSLDFIAGTPALGGSRTREHLYAWIHGGALGAAGFGCGDVALAVQAFDRALAGANGALLGLAQAGQCDPEEAWGGHNSSLQGIEAYLTRASAAKTSLKSWTSYQATRAELVGTSDFALLEALEREELSPTELVPALERAYEMAWVSTEYENDPVLTAFDSASHERVVERFRETDSAVSALAAQHAAAVVASRVPRGNEGEMGVLHRELQKKRRHLPIRKLFERIPTVRNRLKPCLLMSPLSVAQYLGPRDRVDIVIFDEASQLPTADAIGAIARGTQLIVVGDSKQLPPTNFFQRGDEEEGTDSDQSDELESILDECIACRMRELRLRWHYRSQHENLIAFSNYHYYDKNLNTFACADDRGGRLGIRLIPVPKGHYEKGRTRTNRGEADALVAEVVKRLLDPEEQKRSIGIVTFSSAQQTLVQDLLEEERRKHPSIEPFFKEGAVAEHVFVKNLENVQGDERDVVLFSICYGPDSHGRVSMNFGPLNRDGGERRLNVAVTRARQQMLVFSTLRADQIDLRRTSATGVKHLRRFLEYSERGPAAIAEAITAQGNLQFDSPFEEEVYTELEKRGYDLATQVGCSGYRIDLAVAHPTLPGRFVLGIECDGAAYHSAKTARDRDRLRESVLNSLGWRLTRVWSTDWWATPNEVLARLESEIKSALETSEPFNPTGANTELPTISTTNTSESASGTPELQRLAPPPPAATIGEPYIVCRFGNEYSVGSTALAEDIRSVISVEAPIHLRFLGDRLRARHAYARVTSRVVQDLSAEVQYHKLGIIVDDVVWRSKEDIQTYDRVRVPNGLDSERRIDDIPVEELMAAARLLLAHNGAMLRPELVRSVARTFGLQRTGARISERVETALQRLVHSGRATDRDDRISLELASEAHRTPSDAMGLDGPSAYTPTRDDSSNVQKEVT